VTLVRGDPSGGKAGGGAAKAGGGREQQQQQGGKGRQGGGGGGGRVDLTPLPAGSEGRGLHSSTSLFNLSRV